MRDQDAFATGVHLKLAKLPPGTSEIKPPGGQNLINGKAPIYLVDSRPLIRYNQSHLPEAHSIPVPLLEEKRGRFSTGARADKAYNEM